MSNAKKNAVLGLIVGLSIPILSGIAHADGLTATGNTLPIGTSAGTVLTITGGSTSGDANFTGTLETGGQASVNSLAVANGGSFGGNVGIGTTSPVAQLQVNGPGSSVLGGTDSPLIRIEPNVATTDAMLIFGAASPTQNRAAIYSAGAEQGGDINGDLRFATSLAGYQAAANPAMIITGGGNVGIGTTAPVGTLDVENVSGNATICLNGSCLQSVVPTTYSNSNSSPTLNPNWGYIDLQCSVSCQTGHVVSGGCSVGGTHWSSINVNQPDGNGWYCTSHALPQFPMNPPSSVDTLNCYALCE